MGRLALRNDQAVSIYSVIPAPFATCDCDRQVSNRVEPPVKPITLICKPVFLTFSAGSCFSVMYSRSSAFPEFATSGRSRRNTPASGR